MCRVVVAKRDVLQEKDTDALVILEDPFMCAKERIAQQVLQTSDSRFKNSLVKIKSKSHPMGSVVAYKYTGRLKYKTIIQITMEEKWKVEDAKHYKLCLSNALASLKNADNSIAMQLFVGGR